MQLKPSYGIIGLTAVRRFSSMTQQIDPIQIKGLSSKSVDKLNNLANIQNIGNNLELTDDGTLNAVGGGGGGGGGGDVALYSALGSNTNGALTQKASTDLLVHAKPDGENNLIENNKITTGYLPDSVLGQVLYGGGFVPTTGVATLTANAKERLEVSTPTIILTNDTTSPTGYAANEGIYYIATEAGTFASISFQTGDWLISIGTSWSKVDNTDAVTGVKGANEQNYKLGNVNLSAQNIGAVSSTDAVSTESITPFVTTSMINDSAVTSNKIDFTTFDYTQIRPNFSSSIGSGSFSEGSNYDFTTTQPCYLRYHITTNGVSAEYGIVMTSGGVGVVIDSHATGAQDYKFTTTRTLFLPKGVSISCRCFGGATGSATLYSILNS